MLRLSHRNIPIAIIGGGIHGVSIAMRLIRDMPRMKQHLVILDRYPRPLTAWQQKTQRQGMAFLRSPAVHHISIDSLGIVEYARSQNRADELAPPYAQPSTSLFLEFCQREIGQHGIEPLYHRFDVATLRWDKGSGRFPFRLISQNNEGFRARCVILAVGAEDCPYVPPEFAPWLRRFPGRVLHARDFDLQSVLQDDVETSRSSKKQQVLIVGGGLTAGTLAKNLITQGWQVALLTRKPLKIQQFDFHPRWLGPKSLHAFKNETDWEKRCEIIQRVRGEGTVTPEIAETLARYAGSKQGDLALYVGAKIRCIHPSGSADGLRVETTEGRIEPVDLVIFATGYQFDLRKYAFLADLIEQYHLPMLEGLPLLDDELQLHPIENLFASGVMAQLQLGPASGNIAGAALAHERLRTKVLQAMG